MHSAANPQALVKSNHELRARVQLLEDKLARSELKINMAIAASSGGLSQNANNLTVTTNPTSLLSLAESIANASPATNKQSPSSPYTPPPAGTTGDRIDRLVVSNRELRYLVTDKDAKIESLEKNVSVLKREIQCHEAKIVSLIGDIDHANNALRTAVLDAEHGPAEWELDRVRFISAQDKERSQMIELLNRERNEKEDLRLGHLDDIERHVSDTKRAALEEIQRIQQSHREDVERLQQAHREELEGIRRDNDAAALRLQANISQQNCAIDSLNEKNCSLVTDLAESRSKLKLQLDLTRTEVHPGQTDSVVEQLLQLPIQLHREPGFGNLDYNLFPLELSDSDYAIRLLRLLDDTVRPILTEKLLATAAKQTFSTEKAPRLTMSCSNPQTEIILEATPEKEKAESGQTEEKRSSPIAADLPLQSLLLERFNTSRNNTRPPAFSVSAFMSLTPPRRTADLRIESDTVSPSDHENVPLFASPKNGLPASCVDLLSVFFRYFPNEEFSVILPVLRALEVSRSPTITQESFNAVRKLMGYFVSNVPLKPPKTPEAPAFLQIPEFQMLQRMQAQVNAHSRYTIARMTLMGWRRDDVPPVDGNDPHIALILDSLMDKVRFAGVASDAHQLCRLAAPFIALVDLMRVQEVRVYLRCMCRIRQWERKLASMDGTRDLRQGMQFILSSKVEKSCSNANILALVNLGRHDEIFLLANSSEVHVDVVSNAALLRYICLASCVVRDVLAVLASVLLRAEEEREQRACARLHTLSDRLKELAALTLEVDTRAIIACHERTINASLLCSAAQMLRRETIMDSKYVGCYFTNERFYSEVDNTSCGKYCLHDDEDGSGKTKHAPQLEKLLPSSFSGSFADQVTARLLWESPYFPDELPQFDTLDHLSLASLVLRCDSPKLLLQVYAVLPGLFLRLSYESYQQILSQRREADENVESSIYPDPMDNSCAVVPAHWVARFVHPDAKLPGPVVLRRAYGCSIFTLFDCRMFSRIDILRACSFSAADLRIQHEYHEQILRTGMFVGPSKSITVGSVSDFISGHALTPPRGTPRKSPETSPFASLLRDGTVSFLSSDSHHFAPFSSGELKSADVTIQYAKATLRAGPRELQIGGYDDIAIVADGGFTLADLTNSGALRISQYEHIQRLVLLQLYHSTSIGVPVSDGISRAKTSENKTGGWHRDVNWATTHALGDWYGITTDARRNVIKIDLRKNHLSGMLPKCLRLISTLQSLELQENEITGPMPLWLAELPLLRLLNIHSNFFDRSAESQYALSVIAKALPNCRVRA